MTSTGPLSMLPRLTTVAVVKRGTVSRGKA